MPLLKNVKETVSVSMSTIFLFSILVCNASYSQAVKPYIITNPRSQYLITGDTLVLSVKASGTRPFTYQWYDTADIAIATGRDSVFRTGPLNLADNKKGYYCIVTNTQGSVSSTTGFVFVKRPSSELITVNGELYAKDGTVIGYNEKVVKDMIVKLYPAINATSEVYTESFLQADGHGIDVMHSKFMVSLGDGQTNDTLMNVVRSYPDLFVEFSVCIPGGVPEILSPRLPLTSAPYSLAGTPEQISGNVNPVSANISAPAGTYYVNKSTGKTYIKTQNSWVLMD